MALQEIIKTLEKESQEEIKKIDKRTAQAIKELELEFAAKIEEEQENILATTRQTSRRQMDMDLFTQKSKYKQEILRKKRELLMAVYKQAIEKLAKLSEADYEKLLLSLVKKLPSKKGHLLVAKGHQELMKRIVKKLNIEMEVALSDLPIVGGFIWQGENINIDMTFEKLVEELKSQMEIEISQKIFS